MLEKSTNWTKTYKLLCQKWDKTPTNLRAADFPPLVVRASSNRAPTAFLLYEVASAVGAIEFVIRVGRPGSGCEALFGQRAGMLASTQPSDRASGRSSRWLWKQQTVGLITCGC
jgi:hypothetical protein